MIELQLSEREARALLNCAGIMHEALKAEVRRLLEDAPGTTPLELGLSKLAHALETQEQIAV